MLVEMNKQMLASLIKGCDPAYEIMEHPLIKSKGYYSGGHNDRWNWNNSFGDCTEEQLWETYQLLQNPVTYVSRPKPCSITELYAKLYKIPDVEWVYIQDNNDFTVEITVEGGRDEVIAQVLAESLMVSIQTIGDYQVCTDAVIPWKFNIYREHRND